MKVINITIKQTANGADYKACELDQEVLGSKYFNVFQFHSLYPEVEKGAEFPDVAFEKDGKFINLKDGNAPKKSGNKGFAQKIVSENVKVAQDNKAEAIKIASTARMATDIVVAHGYNLDETKTKWKEWRSWFWNNWEMTQDDIMKSPPFDPNEAFNKL